MKNAILFLLREMTTLRPQHEAEIQKLAAEVQGGQDDLPLGASFPVNLEPAPLVPGS